MIQERKQITKRVRFEVFKRDGFVCQYCGAHPPAVILHIDHVIAVANGGTNSMDNLVTSCESCNQGKSSKPLTDVPKSLVERGKEIKEREEQLAEYNKILHDRRERLEDEKWKIAELLETGCSSRGMLKTRLRGIQVFLERLPFEEVSEAAEIAIYNGFFNSKSTFLYFCGICWKKIRGAK